MSDSYKPARKRRGVALPVVIAGGLSSLLLAFSLTPTFSALTAAITNSANTAGTGTLVMTETSSDMGTTCTSGATGSATCSTINKFGGNTASSGYMALKPGGSVTSTVTIKNSGTVDASTFTMGGGTCTMSTNGTVNGSATQAQLCGKFNLVITAGGTSVYTGTAAAFAGTTTTIGSGVTAGSTVTIVVKITLDSSADATYQGLAITQPITWTFGA
ncbi:MAG: hypothetical protein QM779_02430 [Propionicimonas sp.]|uniref:hypothetical protein n=1 Tax=Propionicimonas sp. TaxID=1955623 RepID=UPI003D13314D